ncbi:uncharacterized protein LOC135689225 [Rhopilema esculentum]|uniref:uncharacterized protein LOC135689225 n=1 Tax=Rhopilema esculentum TaxID=499914 RepID=UPI0031D4BB31
MSWRWFFKVIMLVCPVLILAGIPRNSDAKALEKTEKPFQFHIDLAGPVPTRPSVVNSNRKRCCRIGRQAAKKEYSCYVTRNIATIRMNMPMRDKLKTSVHGDKWDFAFCKIHGVLCYHCCNKEARNMDRKRSP